MVGNTPQADYYADPIPSFRFWSGRKNKGHPYEIETGFLCGDGARVIRFFARVIQQLGFWTQKNSSQHSTTATSGAAPSALRSALDSSIETYAQTLSSLAAKKRSEALHVVFFFQQSIRAQLESYCSVCTLA